MRTEAASEGPGPLVADSLCIAVSAAGPSCLRLDWSGRSDQRDPGRTLAPFFDGVIRRAQADGRDIEMHFERLEHFNSSTITALIQVIRAARVAQLRLTLFFDGRSRWQMLSFDALGVFEQSDGFIRIRPAPAAAIP